MEHDNAANAFAALGNPARLQLYRIVTRAGNTGLNLTVLQAKADGMPRSTLVHHISKLVAAGLIKQEKVGASVINVANFHVMDGLIHYLQEECCLDEACC